MKLSFTGGSGLNYTEENSWNISSPSPAAYINGGSLISAQMINGVPVKKKPFGSCSARESPDEGIQTDSGTDVWRSWSSQLIKIRLCNNVKIENRSSVIYWGVIHFQYTIQYQFVDFWTQSVIYIVVIHDIFFRIK